MTLLSHWKLGDGRYNPSTAIDAAAGGSGAHDGSYSWGASPAGGALFPGGVDGSHLYSAYNGGYIDSIGNPADLRLLGGMTIMLWLHHWDANQYWGYAGNRFICNCTSYPWTAEADNTPWDVYVSHVNVGRPYFRWDYGTSPTSVWIQCAVDPPARWYHLAIKRYEISAGYYGVKFYYDGVLVDTQDNGGPGWPAPTGGGNAIPYIGRRDDANNTYYCHYFLDSIRIYDSEESDAAIEAVHDAEEPLVRSDVEFWPVSEPVGVSDKYIAREEGPFSSREGAGFTEGIFS